ncbi:MAG TPA: hypothetical protein VNL36_06190 [Bacteroidota bacterium]|nr:hypothetical protein [Bacteroidota bacterium]
MTNSSSTSFGVYEALRILVPGFYFATLTFLLYRSYLQQFLPVHATPLLMALLVVFLAIVAGLTLYAQETTKRRKAFSENQPSRFLSDKARTMKNMPLLDDDASRKLYFYILNNLMPPAFHEKIFFFGTVYHIMSSIRRTSFWFALVATGAVAFEVSRNTPLFEQQALLLYAIAVWLIYLLNVRYNKADRKMQENYQDQIFWLQMNNDQVESILRKFRDINTPAR